MWWTLSGLSTVVLQLDNLLGTKLTSLCTGSEIIETDRPTWYDDCCAIFMELDTEGSVNRRDLIRKYSLTLNKLNT